MTTLRFFWERPQSTEKDAIGYKGFFYHFLDMKTGRRAGKSEVSTIDTTFFLAGALAAAQFLQKIRTKKTKSAHSPPRFTAAPIGIGR